MNNNTKSNSILEKQVVREVKQVLSLYPNVKVQRINTGSFSIGDKNNKRYIKTAEKGTLDFEGYDRFGRHVAIECKRPYSGKLSPSQKERIDDINCKGGVAFVVTSGKECIEQLKKFGCI